MEYNYREIEKKWQKSWKDSQIYKVSNHSSKPKCYVLDMFPYPSGAGLHVGHPLGYIASDIYARYKRLNGYNVLHPMGYDSFGLPAEQYALETGQHPAETTQKNITTFRQQLDNIGFSYDWSREVRTSDPQYYKWTQWIFLQIFNSWYDHSNNKARPVADLIEIFEQTGNTAENGQRKTERKFSADEWNLFSHKEKQDILMEYRLAYAAYGEVNWCEALGTVLANDEVINGISERGGHLVVKKKMRQWYMRITDYAERLLEGLEKVAFSDAMKDMQRNWIGRSEGAEIEFKIEEPAEHTALQKDGLKIQVYTTRPDTIFGVDFMVLAPEHSLVTNIVTSGQQSAIVEYISYVKSRSDRERLAEVKQITGCFTGAYALNPFNNKKIPIWISEYVLAGYGTGAIMAVPCGDQRDFLFAKHFNIPITNIIGHYYNGEEANPTKEAALTNSDFLNGVPMKDAIGIVLKQIEEMGIGCRKVNYKMRDAGFSRQRYWGEPFPIVYQDGIAHPVNESDLPVELPHVEHYRPGPDGQGPLANIDEWVKAQSGWQRETNTMPGYAGSSWYFLRYMDPDNDTEFSDRKATNYWNQVDVYVGGTEHAVGHLLYSRMWTKVLFDLGYIGFDEPFKRLVNQGMITAKSYFFALESDYTEQIISHNKIENLNTAFRRFKNGHSYVDSNGKLTKNSFIKYLGDMGLDENDFNIKWIKEGEEDFIFLKEESEKMSKSKFNVESPDDVITKYGADTFRMYEMFLGPVEQSKPWDTKGIEGVHRFLKKLWRLFFDDTKGELWNDEKATPAELKILHNAIKKIGEDT
ncbi:MAG: leucine--tRNA ligase, partial [Ginsengibacter sp.]